MWLVTKFGFFSVVAHQDDPDLVLVRGRSREDLEQLRGFGQGLPVRIDVPDIVVTPAADYLCRIFMPRKSWEILGAALAADIDYVNFKRQVHGEPARDAAYMQMWSIMRRYQEQKLAPDWTEPEWEYYQPSYLDPEELGDEDFDEEWDEDEVFDFLDTLRESGAVNMWGARPYLEETFHFSPSEAADWLTKWMESYGTRHGLEES